MKTKKIRLILCAVAFALIISLAGTDSASGVSYDSRASAQKKIDRAISQHKSSLTFYTKKKMNARELFFSAGVSTNINGTKLVRENKAFRGDYNRLGLLRGFSIRQYIVRSKSGKKYYKYRYTMNYKASKARTDYINKRSAKVGKAYRKGSVRQRVKKICKWQAVNMKYRRTNKPTIYEAYKTKKGQCFHYVLMFYKVAKEAGLDVRIVTGKARASRYSKAENHMWCIVRSGGKWYQVDPTWADRGKRISSDWIMKGKNNKRFKATHFPDKKSKAMMKKICILGK